MQKIADAFPWKAIYVYSGYRPNAEVHDGSGHQSLHASGRALDISVYNVPKEELFKAVTLELIDDVRAAISRVRYPGFKRDVVSLCSM